MSYSFSVSGNTKKEVTDKVMQQLNDVVIHQPAHVADVGQAAAVAESFLAILPDTAANQEYHLSISGSVSTQADVVTGVSVNVGVSLRAKVAQ